MPPIRPSPPTVDPLVHRQRVRSIPLGCDSRGINRSPRCLGPACSLEIFRPCTRTRRGRAALVLRGENPVAHGGEDVVYSSSRSSGSRRIGFGRPRWSPRAISTVCRFGVASAGYRRKPPLRREYCPTRVRRNRYSVRERISHPGTSSDDHGGLGERGEDTTWAARLRCVDGPARWLRRRRRSARGW